MTRKKEDLIPNRLRALISGFVIQRLQIAQKKIPAIINGNLYFFNLIFDFVHRTRPDRKGTAQSRRPTTAAPWASSWCTTSQTKSPSTACTTGEALLLSPPLPPPRVFSKNFYDLKAVSFQKHLNQSLKRRFMWLLDNSPQVQVTLCCCKLATLLQRKTKFE